MLCLNVLVCRSACARAVKVNRNLAESPTAHGAQRLQYDCALRSQARKLCDGVTAMFCCLLRGGLNLVCHACMSAHARVRGGRLESAAPAPRGRIFEEPPPGAAGGGSTLGCGETPRKSATSDSATPRASTCSGYRRAPAASYTTESTCGFAASYLYAVTVFMMSANEDGGAAAAQATALAALRCVQLLAPQAGGAPRRQRAAPGAAF